MSEPLSFQSVLDHLLDSKREIPRGHLRLFSDLDPKSLRLFMDVWPSVKPARKIRLLEGLRSMFEEDTVVSYEEIGRALLQDPDAEVRAHAIRLLAESDDPRLVAPLTKILLEDSDLDPRLEAASLLGEFILLGELEAVRPEVQQQAEDALISVHRSDGHHALRKLALESLGYSSRPEIAGLIETANQREDPSWTVSALVAMGRSHDERWSEDVLGKLLDEDLSIQAAAAQAAGELSIQQAVPILLRQLDDEETDNELVVASIWALSQIGGEEARIYLLNLIEQTDDEDMVEFIEDALENMDFTEELNNFDLLSLDADDDLDLEEEEEDDAK